MYFAMTLYLLAFGLFFCVSPAWKVPSTSPSQHECLHEARGRALSRHGLNQFRVEALIFVIICQLSSFIHVKPPDLLCSICFHAPGRCPPLRRHDTRVFHEASSRAAPKYISYIRFPELDSQRVLFVHS